MPLKLGQTIGRRGLACFGLPVEGKPAKPGSPNSQNPPPLEGSLEEQLKEQFAEPFT